MDDILMNNVLTAIAAQSSRSPDDTASGGVRAVDAGIEHRLRGLAEDITAFVALQNSRLERAIGASFNDDDNKREIDRRQAELDTRERGLAQRHREAVEHVEDECDKLSAAWDELEAQQRQLLAQGTRATATPPPPQSQPAVPGLPSTTISHSDIDLIGSGTIPAMTPARAQPWSSEPAAQQFQQMKREINRHARRRKP